MRLGFTGSQKGMTDGQRLAFKELIVNFKPVEFHHGLDQGADDDAHWIVRRISPDTRIIGHPATNRFRISVEAEADCDELRPPGAFLDRNTDIVDDTDRLAATPGGAKEALRSGTWATVRRARKRGKTIDLLWPDGVWSTEGSIG